MFEGNSLQVTRLDGDIAELKFDRKNESVNKFDAATLAELKAAGAVLAADTTLKGLIVTSGKDVFIVGADITEFGKSFQLPEAEIAAWAIETNKIFSAIEDLPFDTRRMVLPNDGGRLLDLDGAPLPGLAPVAKQQGAYVARVLRARLAA